jgi:hypothetical protein
MFFGLLVMLHVTSQAAYVTGIYLTFVDCTIPALADIEM